jgi:ubiquinone/menaquinone biosynthesis C-methylase UbiE
LVGKRSAATWCPAWLDALELQPGECVLDVGSGPGFVSQQIALRVGPQGRVLALDRAPEALAYVERLRTEQGLTQIVPVLGDAATIDLRDHHLDAALVTMMLHHADIPSALIGHIATFLKPGTRAVVAEFDPDGPCTSGPSREHRVSAQTVRAWCEEAGLRQVAVRQQSSEHYMVILQAS